MSRRTPLSLASGCPEAYKRSVKEEDRRCRGLVESDLVRNDDDLDRHQRRESRSSGGFPVFAPMLPRRWRCSRIPVFRREAAGHGHRSTRPCRPLGATDQSHSEVGHQKCLIGVTDDLERPSDIARRISASLRPPVSTRPIQDRRGRVRSRTRARSARAGCAQVSSQSGGADVLEHSADVEDDRTHWLQKRNRHFDADRDELDFGGTPHCLRRRPGRRRAPFPQMMKRRPRSLSREQQGGVTDRVRRPRRQSSDAVHSLSVEADSRMEAIDPTNSSAMYPARRLPLELFSAISWTYANPPSLLFAQAVEYHRDCASGSVEGIPSTRRAPVNRKLKVTSSIAGSEKPAPVKRRRTADLDRRARGFPARRLAAPACDRAHGAHTTLSRPTGSAPVRRRQRTPPARRLSGRGVSLGVPRPGRPSACNPSGRPRRRRSRPEARDARRRGCGTRHSRGPVPLRGGEQPRPLPWRSR